MRQAQRHSVLLGFVGVLALSAIGLGLWQLRLTTNGSPAPVSPQPNRERSVERLPTLMVTAPLLPTQLPATATVAPPTLPTATATAVPPSPTSIPSASPVITATAVNGVLPVAWPPSLLNGDLAASYPLSQTIRSGTVILHYQPGTYPAENIETLTAVVTQIMDNLETALGGGVGQPIDLYLAGTLFSENPLLQGLTRSYEYQTAVLVNGAFHPGERNYILAHELSHIVATHRLGPASSPLLHEGLATYLPQSYLTHEAGYLPHTIICAAAINNGQFNAISDLEKLGYGPTGFGGHIRTFINYNLSGCFIGYLLETYGLEKLDAVYDSSDYAAIYGRSLADLENEWRATVVPLAVPVDALRFIALVDKVAQAYETYINASPDGHHASWPAYLALNQARLATNQGQLEQAQLLLNSHQSLLAAATADK